MRLVILVSSTAAVAAVFTALAASAVHPCVGVFKLSGCQPAPWNGPLMQTWDTPGYYGDGPAKAFRGQVFSADRLTSTGRDGCR